MTDDVRMGGAFVDITNAGVASQHRLQTQRRYGFDGRPQRLQTIVGRFKAVIGQSQVERHPAYWCGAWQLTQLFALRGQSAGEIDGNLGCLLYTSRCV